MQDGEVRESIVVWGNTIIDGHNRYKIVQAHPEIPFKVKQMTFADDWDAIAWMCKNQLGRRNLTEQMRMKPKPLLPALKRLEKIGNY